MSAYESMSILQNEQSKNTKKHLEIWKAQKELVFEFIDIWENNLATSNTNTEESKKFDTELSKWYAKAYITFDSSILKNLNEIFHGSISDVQRYYVYSNIRQQLLSGLFNTKYCESPYINRDVNTKSVKTFDELKTIYPFIERGDEPNTYKTLPVYNTKFLPSPK